MNNKVIKNELVLESGRALLEPRPMTQDAIRRALARLSEVQNELHAALLLGDETVLREYQRCGGDVRRCETPITEQDIREGEEQVRKGEWISLQDLRAELQPAAPASLIERARRMVEWWDGGCQGDCPEGTTIIPLIRDLASAQPEPEKAPESLIERASSYMSRTRSREEPLESAWCILQDLAAAQPEPSPNEPCHVGDDEIVTIVEAQSIGEVLSSWREDTERANRAEAEVERLRKQVDECRRFLSALTEEQ